MTAELTILRPDDWHLHVRDGAALRGRRAAQRAPVRARRRSCRTCARRSTTVDAGAGLSRPHRSPRCRAGVAFEPLMTLYLTDTHAARRDRGARARPASSRSSSTRPARPPTATPASPTCARSYRDARGDAARAACRCSCTARSPIPTSTCSTARRCSSTAQLQPAAARLPGAEDRARAHHDARGARSTSPSAGAHTAATITAHHLLYNRNAIFIGGIRPHYYCLPVLKREAHRAGAGRGGDLGQRPLLPRHRQRAARARAQGARQRLRRLLHRASARSSSTPRPSRPPARSTGSRRSRASTAPASTGCRATRGRSRCARGLDAARDAAVRRRRAEAAARRRDARLETVSSRRRDCPMVDRSPRIALLIDADNSPAAKIGVILNELSTFGETTSGAPTATGRSRSCSGWEEVLQEHAIRPMQQFDYSKGKNASDMAMVDRRARRALFRRPEAFGIVSSDADFTPLVMYLRAKGAAVYGFGGRRRPSRSSTPARAFSSSTRSPRSSPTTPMPTMRRARTRRRRPLRVPTAKLKQDRKLVDLLRNAVEAAKGESGWARVGAVGQQIGNQASFDSRNYGYAHPDQAAEGDRAVPARQGRHLGGRGARRPVRTRRERLSGSSGALFATRPAQKSAAPKSRPCREESLLTASSTFPCCPLRRRPGSRPPSRRPWSWPCARHGWCPSPSGASPSAFRRPAFSSPVLASILVVALRSARVLSDIVEGVGDCVWASPVGALAAVLASALTSARVGADAWAKAPCENTATAAAATAPKTKLVFIEYLLIVEW